MLKLLNVPAQAKFAALSTIRKGDVAQLTVRDNSTYLTRSDGTAPLGVLIRKIRVVDKKTRAVKRYVGEVAFARCLVETDNYDISQRYPISANLFINQDGKFTTFQPTENHPAIGMVTNCPTANNSSLQLVWL